MLDRCQTISSNPPPLCSTTRFSTGTTRRGRRATRREGGRQKTGEFDECRRRRLFARVANPRGRPLHALSIGKDSGNGRRRTRSNTRNEKRRGGRVYFTHNNKFEGEVSLFLQMSVARRSPYYTHLLIILVSMVFCGRPGGHAAPEAQEAPGQRRLDGGRPERRRRAGGRP